MLTKKFGKQSIPKKSLENIKMTAKSFDLIFTPEYSTLGIPFQIQNSNYCLNVFTSDMDNNLSNVHETTMEYLKKDVPYATQITLTTVGKNDTLGVVTEMLEETKVESSQDIAAEIKDRMETGDDQVQASILEDYGDSINSDDEEGVIQYINDVIEIYEFMKSNDLNVDLIFDDNIGQYIMGSQNNHKIKVWYL